MPLTPEKIMMLAEVAAAPAFVGADNIADWSMAWWHPTNAAFQSLQSGLFLDVGTEVTAQQANATADSAKPDDWLNYVHGVTPGVGDWDADTSNRRGFNDATTGYLGLGNLDHYGNYAGTFETFDANAINSEARMACHCMFLCGYPDGGPTAAASEGYIYSFRRPTASQGGSIFVRLNAARTALEVVETTAGTASSVAVDFTDGLFHLLEATYVDNGDGTCDYTALVDGVAGTTQTAAWAEGTANHAAFELFGGTNQVSNSGTNIFATSAFLVRFGGILTNRASWVSFLSGFNNVASFS